LYEEYLKEDGIAATQLEAVEAEVTTLVEQAAEEAIASRDVMPKGESALDGVYANNR
jgi:TPP-dependent pyruvate/acetoin dehydrogenase alpha subunit